MGIQQRKRYKRIREFVTTRDGLICCYCEKPLTIDSVTLDHIIPESRDGSFNVTNLTVSCYDCNNKRGNKPFFEYCKQYNFSEQKLEKYKVLYIQTLKIKVLNTAKEEILHEEEAIPLVLIEQACHILKIEVIDFSILESNFALNLSQVYERKKIKYCFEQLIRLISRGK